jgi:hypothetical protein
MPLQVLCFQMAEYNFLSVTEPPAVARARRVRLFIGMCLATGVYVAVGWIWRRYFGGRDGVSDTAVEGAIAAAIGLMEGGGSKAKAEKLRREFRLNIDSESIRRERPPLTLSRREIAAVYMAPSRGLLIVSTDRRRRIVVPGTLEERDAVFGELASLGLPFKSLREWVVDIALVRAAATITMLVAFVLLWVPGPTWYLTAGAAVLLCSIGWYGIRVGGNPDIEHPKQEWFVLSLAAIGVLWRCAHVLFGLWP